MSNDQHPDDPEPTDLDSAELPDKADDTTRAGGAVPDDSSTGKRLGDFELLRELGRGGMGIVYEARQVSLNRRVALKVLPPALGLTGQATQRFEREARAAAKLHHTNIVPVHFIGEEEGHHFYAMDLIEGQSLDRVLHELVDEGSNPLMEATVTRALAEIRPQSTTSSEEQVETSLSDTSAGGREWFDTVAKLIADVADGLHYAHGRGVIHRDIKPANLMLSKEGHLCITDFGLARVAQEPGMTVSGSFLGTPAYMSPEQIAAGRMKLDHRTDVYSLGTVLYELLALQRPFPGESREAILGAILTKDPRPPRRHNKRIPADLETICLKALEKDPDRRYASAGELAKDLRQYLQGGLIAARRAGLVRRTWKSIRRHPVAAAVTVGVIGIAIVGMLALEQSAGRSAETVRGLVAAAELDLREGTYRQGLEKIERALAIDPGFAEARRTRGRLLFEQNLDFRKLVQVAREFLRENPNDWEAHGWLAFQGVRNELGDINAEEHLAVVERGAPDTAAAWYVRGMVAQSQTERVRCFDRVLELDPGHAWALLGRSSAKKSLHDTAAALADMQAAIVARPRSTRAHRFLAGLYLWDLRDVERAQQEFNKAATIDPEDPDVYNERSSVFSDPERALEEINRAVELAPDNPWFLTDRAFAFARMSRFEDALADARRAIESEPHRYDGWTPLLWSLWKLQRLDELAESMADLRALAENWPSRHSAAEAFKLLSTCHRLLGNYEEAVTAAERAIELNPEGLGGYELHARGLAEQGDDAAVESDCDRMAALDLFEPEPLADRARLMGELCKRPETALAGLDRVVELAPQWAAVRNEIAWMLLTSQHSGIQDPAKALVHAADANELTEFRHADYLDTLALAYHRTGEYGKAIETQRRAISLLPEDAERGEYERRLAEFESALQDESE